MNGSSLFQIATRQYDHFYVQFIFQSVIMILLAKYLTSCAKMQEKNVELLAVGVKVRTYSELSHKRLFSQILCCLPIKYPKIKASRMDFFL